MTSTITLEGLLYITAFIAGEATIIWFCVTRVRPWIKTAVDKLFKE